MKCILTKELGRLARWLRILGFDARYFQEDNVSSLIIEALRQERVILTRNSGISDFVGPRIVKIASDSIQEQIVQVMGTLKLKVNTDAMFTRCTLCNEELKRVEKGRVKEKVPEYVYQTQENFLECSKCSRVYWQGTHWGKVKKFLESAGLK